MLRLLRIEPLDVDRFDGIAQEEFLEPRPGRDDDRRGRGVGDQRPDLGGSLDVVEHDEQFAMRLCGHGAVERSAPFQALGDLGRVVAEIAQDRAEHLSGTHRAPGAAHLPVVHDDLAARELLRVQARPLLADGGLARAVAAAQDRHRRPAGSGRAVEHTVERGQFAGPVDEGVPARPELLRDDAGHGGRWAIQRSQPRLRKAGEHVVPQVVDAPHDRDEWTLRVRRVAALDLQQGGGRLRPDRGVRDEPPLGEVRVGRESALEVRPELAHKRILGSGAALGAVAGVEHLARLGDAVAPTVAPRADRLRIEEVRVEMAKHLRDVGLEVPAGASEPVAVHHTSPLRQRCLRVHP